MWKLQFAAGRVTQRTPSLHSCHCLAQPQSCCVCVFLLLIWWACAPVRPEHSWFSAKPTAVITAVTEACSKVCSSHLLQAGGVRRLWKGVLCGNFQEFSLPLTSLRGARQVTGADAVDEFAKHENFENRPGCIWRGGRPRLRKETEERISVLKLNVGPRCDEHLQLC